jgi:hypothetical protein
MMGVTSFRIFYAFTKKPRTVASSPGTRSDGDTTMMRLSAMSTHVHDGDGRKRR